MKDKHLLCLNVALEQNRSGLPATFAQEFTGLQEEKCNFTGDLQEIFPLNTGELQHIFQNTGELQDFRRF